MTYHHLSVLVHRQAEKYGDKVALKYRDYFDFSEPLKKCTSHRLLAIRRGKAEGILKVSITPDDESACTERLERQYVHGNGECSAQVAEAVNDAYKRLLKPAIETEFSGSILLYPFCSSSFISMSAAPRLLKSCLWRS